MVDKKYKYSKVKFFGLFYTTGQSKQSYWSLRSFEFIVMINNNSNSYHESVFCDLNPVCRQWKGHKSYQSNEFFESFHKPGFKNSPSSDPLLWYKAVDFSVSTTEESFNLDRCQRCTAHKITTMIQTSSKADWGDSWEFCDISFFLVPISLALGSKQQCSPWISKKMHVCLALCIFCLELKESMISWPSHCTIKFVGHRSGQYFAGDTESAAGAGKPPLLSASGTNGDTSQWQSDPTGWAGGDTLLRHISSNATCSLLVGSKESSSETPYSLFWLNIWPDLCPKAKPGSW